MRVCLNVCVCETGEMHGTVAVQRAGEMPQSCVELERRCSSKCLFTHTYNLNRVRRVKAEEAEDHHRPEDWGYVSDIQYGLGSGLCFHTVQWRRRTVCVSVSGQTHWQVVPGPVGGDIFTESVYRVEYSQRWMGYFIHSKYYFHYITVLNWAMFVSCAAHIIEGKERQA